MKVAVKGFVAGCKVCQRNKHQVMSPTGLLQPLPIPQNVWEDVSMDFVGGLSKTKAGDTIMVVVDRLTKYGHFVTLQHSYTAKEVAKVFSREVIKLHGYPKTIVSDRDRVFLSKFCTEMFKMIGTSLMYSSGQTEVVNRGSEIYLRCFCSRQPKSWSVWLPWAEYWYNTNFHSAVGMTPFKAVYGRKPLTLLRWESEGTKLEEVDTYLKERNLILDELKSNLVLAQERMKKAADKRRKDVQYQVGDEVFLKIQPYRFKNLAKRPNEKLSPRYYGPFRIIEKIGAVAYRILLPSDIRIYPVFHISQLKKVVESSVHPQLLPTYLKDDSELQLQPEELVDVRYSAAGQLEVLIRWKELPECENSWEDYLEVKRQYPDFHLEDKVKLKRGGVDRPLMSKVYTRRGGGRNRGGEHLTG